VRISKITSAVCVALAVAGASCEKPDPQAAELANRMGEFRDKRRELRDRLCACKDRTCVDEVNKEDTLWSSRLPNGALQAMANDSVCNTLDLETTKCRVQLAADIAAKEQGGPYVPAPTDAAAGP
jgi:hypothetical protein